MAGKRSVVLVHAQHIRQSKAGVSTFRCGRFADADQAAALRHKAGYFADHFRGFPGISAAPGIPRLPGVDQHVCILQCPVFHIFKMDELHPDRQSCQRFVDVNQRIPVCFMEMPGKRPGAQRAPGMQHGNRYRQFRGRSLAVQVLQFPEIFRHSFNGIVKGFLADG